MKNLKYKTILFDLDGTLLDTNALIISSFMHTLQSFFPERQFKAEEIVPHMGKPLYDMLALYDELRVEEMIDVYREHNLRTHDEMVVAFPHVLEVIQELHTRGIKMGIVTTKQRITVEMGLTLCKLAEYMDSVVTIQDVENPKPHPEPVLKAMSELGAIPESTLMIGDSRYDIESAQRAGVDSAGVAWSLKGEEYLHSFSPTFMLKDMKDLLKLLEE
jgi:pyrophosphatase PpaX